MNLRDERHLLCHLPQDKTSPSEYQPHGGPRLGRYHCVMGEGVATDEGRWTMATNSLKNW
jgi:hypothetical protein